MSIESVKEALLLVLPNNVYHFEAPQSPGDRYIVWGEDSQGRSQHTDNRMTAQAIQGTVDLFTRTEYDRTVEKIQRALTMRAIPFYLRSVDYERETGLIHYQWVWEVS